MGRDSDRGRHGPHIVPLMPGDTQKPKHILSTHDPLEKYLELTRAEKSEGILK